MEWYKINEGPLESNYGKHVWVSDGITIFIDDDFDDNWDVVRHAHVRWAPINYPEPYRDNENVH